MTKGDRLLKKLGYAEFIKFPDLIVYKKDGYLNIGFNLIDKTFYKSELIEERVFSGEIDLEENKAIQCKLKELVKEGLI